MLVSNLMVAMKSCVIYGTNFPQTIDLYDKNISLDEHKKSHIVTHHSTQLTAEN